MVIIQQNLIQMYVMYVMLVTKAFMLDVNVIALVLVLALAVVLAHVLAHALALVLVNVINRLHQVEEKLKIKILI